MRAPPRVRGGLVARLVVLVVGLFLFALGIACQVESELGLAPWDVLHQGLAKRTPLTLGSATIVVGVAVLVLAWRLGARVGVGTIANAVLVGAFLEALLRLSWFARLSEQPLAARIALLAAAVALIGAGSALYLGANLGAGPRDSLMVVGSERLHVRIGAVRAALEVSALAVGFALGGVVGVGTLAFALAIGPAIEAACWTLLRTPWATPAAEPRAARS